jgi:glycosyltransferase involved in cell wall biosynthesis
MNSERPLHVGIDATTWANDRGFGRFTRELLTALVARDAGFRYTLLFDQPPDDGSVPTGVASISAATSRSLNEASRGTNTRSLSYLWRMGRAARRAGFDVFFFPAVYSYYPILARVPCVVCYHDTTAERLPELLFPSALNHRLWQAKTFLAKLQTTRAMTVSTASANDLRDILHIPPGRIDVVTEAADPIFRVIADPDCALRARARYNIPADAQLLVYIGGMNRHKNILGLLQAMPDVVAARPEAHLAIVGDTSGAGFWDNVPELRRFIAERPALQQHVTFTNRIADGELVELLNGTAALVFPSLWEGFGLPAVEAMACGVPVLSSDRGSLPEVVGDAGLFFDPLDTSSIVSCLVRFLGDAPLRRQLSEAARLRAATFSWDRAAELAEDSFRRAAGHTA